MAVPKLPLRTSTIALALLAALVLGVFQWPSLSIILGQAVKRADVQEISVSGPNTTLDVFSIRADEDIFPDRDRYFNFYQFENARTTNGYWVRSEEENYKRGTIKAIVRIHDILDTVIYPTLFQQKNLPIPTDPSFLRYFRATKSYADMVTKVLIRINQAIGSPRYNLQRSVGACPPTPKIDIYYLDPPDDVLDEQGRANKCMPWDPSGNYPRSSIPFAYNFKSQKPDVPNGLVLCEQFFMYWRDYDEVEKYKDYIKGFVEFGFRAPWLEPSWMSAFTLLHELLHMRALYSDFFPLRVPSDDSGYYCIEDVGVLLQDPAGRYGLPTQKVRAYGPFAAWQVNIGATIYGDNYEMPLVAKWPRAWVGPLWNVDNYVYLCKEIYLQKKLGLADAWLDPVPAFGPYVPPNYDKQLPHIVGHPFFNNDPPDSADLGRNSPNPPFYEAITPDQNSPDPDLDKSAGDECCEG